MGDYMANMLEGIEQEARKTLNVEDCYFVESEDVYYCSKCNQPRELWVEPPRFVPYRDGDKVINGKKYRKVVCTCKCYSDESSEKARLEKQKKFVSTINVLKQFGFYDEKLKKCTFRNDNGTRPDITKKAKEYCGKWQIFKKDNIGLLLYGNQGTGKTFFASCIANYLLFNGEDVILTNMSTIINALMNINIDKKEYLERLKAADLLVIDDLGAERQSEFALEQVFNVIDSRYRCGKPIIITTNLPLIEIKNPKDTGRPTIDEQYKRIYSRINGMTVPIAVLGDDVRELEAAAKLKRAKELFSN